MLTKTFLTLGAATLVTGALFFSGSHVALASGHERQVRSTSTASDRCEREWEFHRCFKHKCDAEDECDRLRSRGWDAKWKKENGKYCVYKRRSR
jgi:hypothetical protein